MPTAAELLMGIMAGSSIHIHPVTDDESRFVINPSTRQIEKVGQEPNILIQGDHNSEVYTFEIPRYIEGHDMMLCNRIYVHIINIDGGTREQIEDLAEMYDLAPDVNNPDIVVSSWTIRRESIQRAGVLSFLIEYQCVDEDGEVTYEFHTDVYSDVEVHEGRNNGPAAIIEYNTILEQWQERLFGGGESVVAEIVSTGDNKLAEITEEVEKQKADITAKGEATLATIPSEYTELYNLANSAERTKSDAITLETGGSAIVVDDSSDDYIRGLKIYGKTTQATTTGAQLANLPDYEVELGGITWTCSGGIVKAVGTCNSESSSTGNTIKHDLTGMIGTFHVSGSISTVKVYVRVTKDGSDKWYSEKSFTLDGTEDDVLFYLQVADVGTVANAVVYPMLNAGDVALPWEPYTGGKASPNPDYPQEVVGIDNPIVYIGGKNLIDDSVLKDQEVLSVHGNMPVHLVPGEYCASVSISGNISERDATLVFYSESKERIAEVNTLKNETFVIPKEVTSVTIYPFSGAVGGTWEHILIAEASCDKDYGPYRPEQSVQLERTLNGLNGVCDEVDFARGKYVQRVVSKIFDGTETFTRSGTRQFGYHIPDCIGTANTIGDAVCSHFLYSTSSFGSASVTGFVTHNKYAYFRKTDLAEDTVTAFRAWLAEQYNAGNPVKLLYVLLEHIETPLSESELEAFRTTRTNHPVTTVLNDKNAQMELKYNADTLIFLRDHQPIPTDEQVKSSIDKYLDKTGVQVPSDDHILALIDETIGGIVNDEY